jgi:hypothetical protein
VAVDGGQLMEEEAAGSGARLGDVVGGSGSKTVAHVEDIEAKLSLGFDSDGRVWTAVAMVSKVAWRQE